MTMASRVLCISSSASHVQRARLAPKNLHFGGFTQDGNTMKTRVVVASAARTFKVTLQTPLGEKVIQVADDVYVSDAAESAGIPLPVSCRSGNCSSCAAILKSGQVDQSYQTFLDDDKVAQGFILTCVAYPLSDIVIETHQESRLYS